MFKMHIRHAHGKEDKGNKVFRMSFWIPDPFFKMLPQMIEKTFVATICGDVQNIVIIKVRKC